MKFKVYKIYNPHLGKFARAGTDLDSSRWANQGKGWNQLSHVKTHLRAIELKYTGIYGHDKEEKIKRRKELGWVYKDCKLVEFDGQNTMETTIKIY